ncbi:MAG: porin family protein [Flavobacteriaceae bacterium]|nr:PorT family protein [Mangrovimonas sp.]HRV54514.1 porin family protein [Mangrovimonas sp.]
MKYNLFLALVLGLTFYIVQGQEDQAVDSLELYKYYREDQFYVGGGYTLLANKPKNLSQSGFSSFINLGFIRDIPINDKRNFGVGLGLGYALNSVNQNMLIGKGETGEYEYIILSEADINYSKNKFQMHILEVPFEIRWRTSTPLKHEFVRVYLGFKAGYVFATRSVFKNSEGTEKHKGIKDFNSMQYGLTLSAGYNTWNAHIYYGLNPVFENGILTSNGEKINMRTVRIGLMFYLL